MKKLLIDIIVVFFLFASSFAKASTIVAVNSHSCEKITGSNKPFILVLKTGESVSDAILQCTHDANLPAASLSGLGALANPTLGYFNTQTKKYQEQNFVGTFELVALSGNVIKVDGKLDTHIHVAFAGNNYHVLGGHLLSAKVGPTAEITIIPLEAEVVKKFDKNTGLKLISTE